MQPMKRLNEWLYKTSDESYYLFRHSDMRALFPDLSDASYKTLLSRAATNGTITRVCRSIYVAESKIPPDGRFLFHVAAMLRANDFNYISLETALSDSGVISQIPINWITIMSSGRSSTISCQKFGTIEFVHTTKKPQDIREQLAYDDNCGLWRASTSLALKDMKRTHRNTDLINWEIADELTK